MDSLIRTAYELQEKEVCVADTFSFAVLAHTNTAIKKVPVAAAKKKAKENPPNFSGNKRTREMMNSLYDESS